MIGLATTIVKEFIGDGSIDIDINKENSSMQKSMIWVN